MSKKYIALLLGAAVLYGCGGSNSSTDSTPGDQPPDLEELSAGKHSGWTTIPETANVNFVFEKPEDYQFMNVWIEGVPGTPVDFDSGKRVAITISNLAGNYLKYNKISWGENFTYTQLNFEDYEDVNDPSSTFPYVIASFTYFGDQVTFTRNFEKHILTPSKPTYEELVNEDVQRRAHGGEEFPEFLGDNELVLAGRCPLGNDSDLVEVEIEELWELGHQTTLAGFCLLDGVYYLLRPALEEVKGPFIPGKYEFPNTERP